MSVFEKLEDKEAFGELIRPTLEQAGITDPEDIALMTSDEATERMFSANFKDLEGSDVDPSTFLQERLAAKKEINVSHRGVLPEHMATPSESWHNDNRDNPQG